MNMVPLGITESYNQLLNTPPDDQLLYKIMCTEDLIRSISDSYFHFNRVDSYTDFDGADTHDGEQLPKDLNVNQSARFIKAPDFSAADYYNQFCARTYACCFSLENSDHIWINFGNGGKKGKVCLVLRFDKLRENLNEAIQHSELILENKVRLRQLFDINYGLIEYIDRDKFRSNTEFYQKPIKYVYFKDKEKYQREKELRITLSTIGIGKLILKDGREIDFPKHLHLGFNFGPAIGNGTIVEILHSPDCDLKYFQSNLQQCGIDIKNKGS